MISGPQATSPEAILARLRRLVTLWRATYIVQMVLLLLFVLAAGLEITMPGVLVLLLRSELAAQLLLPCIGAVLLGLDPVAALVEHRMGRLLKVPDTSLRQVLRWCYLIPGVMLLRRTLLVVLALLWLLTIVQFLLWWFLALVLLFVVMRISEPVGEAIGVAVDTMDRGLNWLYTVLRETLRTISLSPARNIESEEHIVLPLLQAQLGGARYAAPPAGEPSAPTAP